MRIRDLLTGSYQKTDRSRKKDLNNVEFQRKHKTESAGKTQRADSTSISQEARQLQQAAELITESVEILKAMPDIREEAVARAKDRVATGYYDQTQVIDTVATIIDEHLQADSPVSASDLATDIISNFSPENADFTKADLDEIRMNLEKGLYQDSEVIEEVARKIYSFLNDLPSDG